MRATALSMIGVLLCAAAPPAGAVAEGPDRPGKPFGATEATDDHGRFIGWRVGIRSNPVTIIPVRDKRHARGAQFAPTRMTHDYKPRSITTVAEWEKARADIHKRILGFLGRMPPTDLPLDARDGPRRDEGDYETRRVNIAFSKTDRGRLCLVIPKGIPTPAPALIVYGGYGCGIRKHTKGFYCRAFGPRLARLGMIVVVQDHWYDRYGASGDDEIVPLAASVHMGRRIVDYLLTRKDLVNPRQIGLFGHVYGAEIAPFLAAVDDRIAAVVSSCSSDVVIAPQMAYWPGPVWLGRYPGLGCVQRYHPRLFVGRRRYDLGPTHGEGHRSHAKLPFLSQELRAMAAPRPYLSIQESLPLVSCIGSAWELYGREKAVEVITHKWKTNLPVNAQEYMVDFFLRRVCGIQPGRADKAKVDSVIVAGLRSPDPARQLRAARMAVWWKPKAAAEELDRLIGSEDVAVRRTAAKALGRIGQMDRLFKHFQHDDPGVRLAVVEAMQLHGRQKHFDVLYRNQDDPDNWVREAKFQTFEINPEEWP